MIYLSIAYFEHVRTPWCFGGTTRLRAHGGVPKVTAAPLLLWVAGAKPTWRWCLSPVYTAGEQGATLKEPPKHSQRTLWSCAVTWLWDCAIFPICFYVVGALWNKSLPLCPHWTITPSNGMESCCSCKVSQKLFQKLQLSRNKKQTSLGFKQVQRLWIQSNKSLSFSVWRKMFLELRCV